MAASLRCTRPSLEFPYNLPAGAVGQVAAYKDRWPMFAVIRRILLRMKSWLNCAFTEGR